MMVAEFAAGDWIDRLARALPCVAESQERYLQRYRELTPRVYGAFGGRDRDRDCGMNQRPERTVRHRNDEDA